MSAEGRSASAALLLGALAMAFAMPSAVVGRVGCEVPFERAADAQSGFTTHVGCGVASQSDPSVRGPARLLFGLPLDLNRATREALQALPAIGPARAEAIVVARVAQRFHRLEDLERVAGIGRKTSQALRGWATVTSGPEPLRRVERLGRDGVSRWTDR